MLRVVDYRDAEGRTVRVLLPEEADDSDAPIGLVVGPPDLTALGLPTAIEVRLNNELHSRGLFTLHDARRRFRDLEAAVRAALRFEVSRVMAMYEPSSES